MDEFERLFKCPTEECGFFITMKKMAEILSDPNHILRRFLSDHEKIMIHTALLDMGVRQ